LQHPMGVASYVTDDSVTVFIADAYNHKVRNYLTNLWFGF
jgi:hypothetical protein